MVLVIQRLVLRLGLSKCRCDFLLYYFYFQLQVFGLGDVVFSNSKVWLLFLFLKKILGGGLYLGKKVKIDIVKSIDFRLFFEVLGCYQGSFLSLLEIVYDIFIYIYLLCFFEEFIYKNLGVFVKKMLQKQ